MNPIFEQMKKDMLDTTKERDLARCGDCGALEGRYHEDGCDMEICSVCGGQKITCNCVDSPKFPYIHYPNMCVKCGKLYPELYMVDDKEWEHYIIVTRRDEIICWDCYQKIKRLINKTEEK